MFLKRPLLYLLTRVFTLCPFFVQACLWALVWVAWFPPCTLSSVRVWSRRPPLARWAGCSSWPRSTSPEPVCTPPESPRGSSPASVTSGWVSVAGKEIMLGLETLHRDSYILLFLSFFPSAVSLPSVVPHLGGRRGFRSLPRRLQPAGVSLHGRRRLHWGWQSLTHIQTYTDPFIIYWHSENCVRHRFLYPQIYTNRHIHTHFTPKLKTEVACPSHRTRLNPTLSACLSPFPLAPFALTIKPLLWQRVL